MNLRRVFLVPTIAMFAIAAVPNRASADWYITPFIGGNLGAQAGLATANTSFDDQVERRIDMGASLGWMGKGIAGFEIDYGWSPNFFQNTTGSANFAFGDSNVTTLMGNVVVGIPVGGQRGGGVRPYVTGGAGLTHSSKARTLTRGATSRALVTEGPYAESVEQLSGFYLVTCDEYDALVEAAQVLTRAHPVVEIRPVEEY